MAKTLLKNTNNAHGRLTLPDIKIKATNKLTNRTKRLKHMWASDTQEMGFS